jgi:membrane associated rhomboid family serine protease
MPVIQFIQRIPLTLVLASLALVLHRMSVLQSWSSLEFREFSALELHRILTCHWLHWSAEHLVWDLGVFIILGAWCEQRTPARYAWTMLLSAVAIPVCVMCCLSHVNSYRGLSGIDTALFGLLAANILSEKIKHRETEGMVLFGLFV